MNRPSDNVALRPVIALLAVLFAAPVIAQSPAAKTVSFKRDIQPRLYNQCAYCHQSYDRHGYLVLDNDNAYSALVNVNAYQLPSMKRIAPGDPDNSYVWLKSTNQHVQAGGKGWNMPIMQGIYGQFKEDLYNWILQGAKNN